MRRLIISVVLAGASAAHGGPLTNRQIEDAVQTFEDVITRSNLAATMNRPVDPRPFAQVFGVPFEYAGFDLGPQCNGWSASGRIDDPAKLVPFAACASESLTIPMYAQLWSDDLDRSQVTAALRTRVDALARNSTLVVGEVVADESKRHAPRPGWVLIALHRTKSGSVVVDAILLSPKDPIPLREPSPEIHKAIDAWLAVVQQVQGTLVAGKDDCASLRSDIDALLRKPELAASKRVLRHAQLRGADLERMRIAQDAAIGVAKTVCKGDLEAKIDVEIDVTF